MKLTNALQFPPCRFVNKLNNYEQFENHCYKTVRTLQNSPDKLVMEFFIIIIIFYFKNLFEYCIKFHLEIIFNSQRDLEKNPQLKQLFVFQEILELIDISIEMKSDPRAMNRTILDLTSSNFLVRPINCL